MAKAIRQIRKEVPNPQQEQQEAIADMLKELADNREAIMGAIGILKGLQEMRVLETVGALLDQRNEVERSRFSKSISQPCITLLKVELMRLNLWALSSHPSLKPSWKVWASA